MTSLEVSAILLAKFLGGEAITWAGGHLLATTSGTTLTHMSMIAKHNVMGAVTASSGAPRARMAAYHSCSSFAGLMESMGKRRSKTLVPNYQLKRPERSQVHSLAFLSQALISSLNNYINPWKSGYGELKGVSTISGSDMPDFHDFLNKRQDPRAGPDEIDLHLITLICYTAEVYQDLQWLDKDGNDKTDVTKIAGCTNCGCGSRYSSHDKLLPSWKDAS
ncbi:hypothetical protein BKA65DRAFT_539612 [Rhexocercosporidium sp. MPI-PUGE-AT-0058]|nr:hypothetical protein BKA65DRAFT_539612 [Rhexocercosporidium sp. MPI-PUGE-AT-0058]